MNYTCAPTSFESLLSEKREIEKETEYLLPEYLPNVQSIVRTDINVKIDNTSVGENNVSIGGRLIYTVLYVSEHDGVLKSAVFTDEMNVYFDTEKRDIETYSDTELHTFTDACVITCNVKAAGQRRIAAKARIGLSCEVLLNAKKSVEKENEAQDDACDIQYLLRTIESGGIGASEESHRELNEEIHLEEDMPEIAEVLSFDGSCCVKEVNDSGMGTAEAVGELSVSCLYTACREDGVEYVSFTKEIPFRLEVAMPETVYGGKLLSKVTIASLNVDSVSDSYGDRKVLAVNAELVTRLFSFGNESVSVCEDLYSTECVYTPIRQRVRNFTFIDTFTGLAYAEERLRTELRGISEIIGTDLKLCFGMPENVEGKIFLPARGVLSILGQKENGEVESVRTSVAARLQSNDIPLSLFDERRIKWLNTTALCSHKCEMVGGELLLKIWVQEGYAAFRDESPELVCGCERSEEEPKSNACSFTLYYPDEAETVWNVAKAHAVSVERVKAENNIEGDRFTQKGPVVLR